MPDQAAQVSAMETPVARSARIRAPKTARPSSAARPRPMRITERPGSVLPNGIGKAIKAPISAMTSARASLPDRAVSTLKRAAADAPRAAAGEGRGGSKA